MEYSDKSLTCVDCGQPFVFSVGEQIFFSEKQFQHDPKRCKACKAKRTNVRARVETRVMCAACGADTIVPFVPHQARPVLCRACFYNQRADAWLRARVLEQVKAVEDRRQRLPGGGELVG
jgi:CxxC-x17-CxxC domain-containing protein